MKKLSGNAMQVFLPYNPPFDWLSVLAFFRAHQIIGIETISETIYERVFRIGPTIGHLSVKPHKNKPQLVLSVVVNDKELLPVIKQKVRKMFDLDLFPDAIAKHFAIHDIFGDLSKSYPGLRLGCGWDSFETSINTILGQLVSVSRARDLMRQLVEFYGEKIFHPITGEATYLFPSPEKLAKADLTQLGTTQARKKTINEFSRLIAIKQIDLATTDIDMLKKKLLAIPGIGPWSVEYIALRALGHADAFPATDLILKRAVERLPGFNLELIRPWRSYAAIYLWKHYALTRINNKNE